MMKEMELKNLKSLNKLVPLKKTITQLLIPLSIFSLAFAYFSSTSLHHQTLHYFSCNSLHLRSLAVNKNCIFLICNGILFFLASLHPPSPPDADDTLQRRIRDALQSDTSKPELLLSDKVITSDESTASAEDDDEHYENEEEEEEEEEREVDHQELEHCSNEVVVYIGETEDIADQDEPRESWLFDEVDDRDDDEEEEEDDEIEKLSTEELNQRFEDFIRRMKEEFRVNEYNKQQLVAVK